jgi:hypothetical protein
LLAPVPVQLLAQQRRGSNEYQEGHAEARRAFLIG